ncbi:hypothetical protein RJZ57_008247, partial [Blastomyces gilchristii]
MLRGSRFISVKAQRARGPGPTPHRAPLEGISSIKGGGDNGQDNHHYDNHDNQPQTLHPLRWRPNPLRYKPMGKIPTKLHNNPPHLPTKNSSPHLPTSCEIIASVNHGYDGIDTDELGRRGIWYCNGAGAANDSTADIALFLILAAFRYTTFSEGRLREMRAASYFSMEGDVLPYANTPRNRILGVVGMGGIGGEISVRARAEGGRCRGVARWGGVPSHAEGDVGGGGLCGAGVSAYARDASYFQSGDVCSHEKGGAA